MVRVGVLGAGTWGMALARLLCLNGHEVTVWSALPEEIDYFAKTRRHPNLPGMMIPNEILFTKELECACKDKNLLVFAVPSTYVRGTAKNAARFIPNGQIIVDVAKGMESDTLYTLTEVIVDELKKADPGKTVRLVALSGPTHAEEVAKDIPSTIVSASRDEDASKYVQDVFMNKVFRVYTNDDIKGVELSGAVKNVMALASGICSGMGFGDNTRAALITRGIAEIKRLGKAMDCNEQTFTGLAGIGDLIVTAMSVHSRNNRCGMLIGQGKSVDDAKREIGMVVEGINAIPAILLLKRKYNVQMPIVDAVAAVIQDGADPRETVTSLMLRDKKDEL